MAEQIFEVHKSKLTYATLRKMLEIVDNYLDIKTNLTYYFPSIIDNNEQWRTLRKVIITFLNQNTNWSGISPNTSSSVSDYTNLSRTVQTNNDDAAHLYNRLLNTVDFGEESIIDFTSTATWTNIVSRVANMINLESLYTMHRQIYNGIVNNDSEYIDKTPGQLSLYDNCEMPLPTNQYTPDNANFNAFVHILGDDNYYTYLPVYDIDWVSRNVKKRLTYKTHKTTIDSSPYTHSAPIGAILWARTPDGEFLTNTSYDDEDTVNISGVVSDTELRILELYGEGEEEEIERPLTPSILKPEDGDTVFNKFDITTSSLQISGGLFDYHVWTTWQLSDTSDFSNILWESYRNRTSKTSITLSISPSGYISCETESSSGYLETNDTIYCRVKHRGGIYGESEFSDSNYFYTPYAWTCDQGIEDFGGIIAGSINDNCIIVGKFDSEPTATNDFYIHTSETEQLSGSISSGDMSYREDEDIYYVNTTGNNDSMDDWLEIKPQPEANYDMFVDSESEMLSLEVSAGNIAIRTDEYKCYTNKYGTNDSMSDWIELDTPAKIWWLAKQYCLNLEHNSYDDWYLPWASELNMIQNNMDDIDDLDDTGDFRTEKYWSSTVDVFDEKYMAWVEDFDDGSQSTKDRDANWFFVRPVRRL